MTVRTPRLPRIAATTLVLGALALSVAGAADKAAAPKPAAGKTATGAAKSPASAGDKTRLIAEGRRLATIAGCGDCHTPGTLFGVPDFARTMGGSELGWQGPWGTTYARNITPDPETGLGYYSAKEIVAALRGGKRLDGNPMLPPMPWQDLAACTDEELTAIAEYLLSLPAVVHVVPDRIPPGVTPTGSFLTFPAPSAWDAPKVPPGGSNPH
jgi:mono/diheme cytochrome c family protein